MKSLDGSWRGKGAVTPMGRPEFIACKVSYSMGGADVIRQVIACAGTDYRVEVASRVTCEGNRLEGLFEENIAHSQGLVRGSISGSNLLIEAESPIFKGNFNVTFRAGNHLVAIAQGVQFKQAPASPGRVDSDVSLKAEVAIAERQYLPHRPRRADGCGRAKSPRTRRYLRLGR